MRSRKKELEAIVELLSCEHDDVDTLATEVWKLIDSMRRDRDIYVVVARHAGVNFIYGTYETENSAIKDVELGSIKKIGNDDRYMVLKVHSPSKIFESDNPTLFDIK